MSSPCLNSRSSLGRKSSWDGALDKTFETKQLGAEPLCVTWRSGREESKSVSTAYQPRDLEGDLDFLSATWGPLALVREWQEKGEDSAEAWAAVVRTLSEAWGSVGRSGGRWGPGLDCARQGLAPSWLRDACSALSGLRAPTSECAPARSPLCVCCSMERHPRSGDTAFHPLNWPLLLLGLFKKLPGSLPPVGRLGGGEELLV